MKKLIVILSFLLFIACVALWAWIENENKNKNATESLNATLEKSLGEDASIDTVKKLILQGANVNISGAEYNPLSLAIKKGDFDFLKFLVEEKKANVNIGHMTGTALHEAVRQKNRDMVSYLLTHGADANTAQDEENGETPIIYAARVGNREIAEMLLGEKADINFRSRHTETTAWCEARRISSEWADFFKESGADVSAGCPESPLEWEGISDRVESDQSDDDGNLACECAGKCSEATKDFKNRICKQPDIPVEEIDTFISAGADINAAFKIGYEGVDYSSPEAESRQTSRPVFHLSGNALRRIVEKGANIGVKDDNGNTLLMHLLTNDSGNDNSLELVKLLLDKKAEVNISNNNSETPLAISVKKGNESFVKLLLEYKANPDRGIISIDGPYNKTVNLFPLEYAAHDGNAKIVEILLKRGAKVNDTRAHLIAAKRVGDKNDSGKNIFDDNQKENLWAITKALLEKGANINIPSSNYPGGTVLQYAIYDHNLGMVKYIVEHGADLELENYPFQAWQLQDLPNGKEIQEYIYSLTETMDDEAEEELNYSPIHNAIRKRDLKTVEKILKDSPDAAKAVDANGNSTLHVLFYSYSCSFCDDTFGGALAVFKIHLMATEDDMKSVLELLLKNGADVNAVNKNGKTPLHSAAEYGAPEDLTSVLLARSANINARDKYGKTPLHYAKRSEAAKYLINNGADVNAASTVLKRTPLHVEAKRGNDVKMIKALLEAGADKRAKDKYGKIPFDIVGRENNEIREILK